MVNLPPEQNERRDRGAILSFDEMVAVALALLGVGAVLWWGMGRGNPLVETGSRLGMVSLDGERGNADGLSLFSDEVEVDLGLDSEAAVVAPSATRRTGVSQGNQGLSSSQTRARTGANGTADSANAAPSSRSSSRSTAAVTTGSQSMDATNSASMDATNSASSMVPTTTPNTADGDVATTDTNPAEGATTPPPLDISDVPADHWAYSFIKPMYDQGYLPDLPSGQFQPDSELTRAELAALLDKAFELEASDAPPQAFVDVPDNYWASESIAKAVAGGYMSGYPENEFKPDQPVPRYQVVVVLSSGLNLAPSDNADVVLQQYIDTQTLPDWSKPQIAAATDAGLVVNHPSLDQLRPDAIATRAEITAMIHQALVNQGKLEPVKSPYVLPPVQ
jgi:hypothetical protein